MHILFVTPEVAPFSSSGESGEISGTLARALRELDIDVTVLTPFYQQVSPERYGLARRIRTIEIPIDQKIEEIGLLDGKFVNVDVPVIFVDHPHSFQRDSIYGPFADNHYRFYLFCRAALAIVEELDLKVELIQAIDWPTGFIPLLLRQGMVPALRGTPILFTLNDPHFAGLFEPQILEELGLGYENYNPDGIEFHGQVSLLKAGLVFSDAITTHSSCYAREITSEEFGAGFHGVFHSLKDRLSGIHPGIDPTLWNPATSQRIAKRFQLEDLTGKEANKQELQNELKLRARPQLPLAVTIGPFIDQAAFEILLQVVETLSPHLIQVAFLGPIKAPLKNRLATLIERSEGSIAWSEELDVDRLHRTFAGADAVIFPPSHGPGGQTHLKAMRYGTIPLARATGGIIETVVDFDRHTGTGTGITFSKPSTEGLSQAINRMLSLYKNKKAWRQLITNAMRQSFSYLDAAKRYQEIYRSLLNR